MTTTNKLVDNKAPMMGVINISFDCQEIYDKIIWFLFSYILAGSLKQLIFLSLHKNMLSGTIPSTIGTIYIYFLISEFC